MKKLMMTAAAIAISATSAFAAAPSDVEHRVDNPYSYSSWANAFYIEYANEFGGQAFTNLNNTITTLENIVASTKNELENEHTSYQIYLETGMEADAELSEIQIYALSGKIQGTNQLIATIEGLHDTSALDDANETIDHLNDQLAYWGTVIADQKAELATIAAETTAEVTAEFEVVVSGLEADLDSLQATYDGHVEALISANDSVVAGLDAEVASLEATVLTATAVNTELKGELFESKANNQLLADELSTINDIAEGHYEARTVAEAELEAANATIAQVKTAFKHFTNWLKDYGRAAWVIEQSVDNISNALEN